MTPTVDPDPGRVQVKVCGLTRPGEAEACAAMGVDALGLVFYPKSPRHVTTAAARAIAGALPPDVRLVGVFVNPEFEAVVERVEAVGLWGVQLHGQEPPQLVRRILDRGTPVLKALFRTGKPPLSSAGAYGPSAFLVESGVGVLPGGNAAAWDWSDARTVSERHPMVLAGGLSPQNVAQAALGARADAVDVSSGVEDRPGRKNLERVAAFMAAVSGLEIGYRPRRVF